MEEELEDEWKRGSKSEEATPSPHRAFSFASWYVEQECKMNSLTKICEMSYHFIDSSSEVSSHTLVQLGIPVGRLP